MNVKILELANGLRVLYNYIPHTRAVHCGFVINSGSRDDARDEIGMAHFIEHMIFKGTRKRKTFHILNYLESVGGELNAYTTKEKTCLYGSVVAEYFERATELLSDIMFNSVFPDREIDKEKQVIAEEIDMYRNASDEAIFEDFDEMVFPAHGLGHPILGTKSSIRKFTKDRVQQHLQQAFVQGQVVFSIAGNVSEARVRRVIDRYLKDAIIPGGEVARWAPDKPLESERTIKITADQAHEIMGGRAYAMHKDLYLPFLVLNNLLGGPAMNSRLNLNIRERHGLTYNIQSFYQPYVDSGMWGIYYACEARNLNRIRRLVEKELKEMWSKPLGTVRLNQARKQLIGQLTLGYENPLNQMLGQAKDLLDFDEVMPFTQMVAGIEAVTAQGIQEAAEEIFRAGDRSLITYRRPA